MNAVLAEKRCTRCTLTMPLSYFSPRSDSPGNYASRCRDCCNRSRNRPPEIRPSRCWTARPDPLLDMGWFVTAGPLVVSVGQRL